MAAGVRLTERGFIAVDEHCQTSYPIYAVGDVIGPPHWPPVPWNKDAGPSAMPLAWR